MLRNLSYAFILFLRILQKKWGTKFLCNNNFCTQFLTDNRQNFLKELNALAYLIKVSIPNCKFWSRNVVKCCIKYQLMKLANFLSFLYYIRNISIACTGEKSTNFISSSFFKFRCLFCSWCVRIENIQLIHLRLPSHKCKL